MTSFLTRAALVCSVLCVTLFLTVACGNGGNPAPGPQAATPAATDVGVATQADGSFMSTLSGLDPSAAAATLDSDFEWTDSQGRTHTRAQTVTALPSLAGEFRNETDRQAYHYGHVHVITSARPEARMMRVWALRPDGWRLFAVISTALATGTTPFAAAGAPAAADCENPCQTMPFEPVTETTKEIARIFQQLKLDEWRPNPDSWAPYVLDDVYYVTATAQLSKGDRVEHLRKLKESGAASVPGDPVDTMRIHDFGDSAVMIARHTPFRGGKPYYSLRVWAFRDGRWQLANTQQTVIS